MKWSKNPGELWAWRKSERRTSWTESFLRGTPIVAGSLTEDPGELA